MSVQTGRMVSADEARGIGHALEPLPPIFGDLAHTVVTQAEQIAAVLALHWSITEEGRAYCAECGSFTPCPTARALGVSGE